MKGIRIAVCLHTSKSGYPFCQSACVSNLTRSWEAAVTGIQRESLHTQVIGSSRC
jgi:hypothetical protein